MNQVRRKLRLSKFIFYSSMKKNESKLRTWEIIKMSYLYVNVYKFGINNMNISSCHRSSRNYPCTVLFQISDSSLPYKVAICLKSSSLRVKLQSILLKS